MTRTLSLTAVALTLALAAEPATADVTVSPTAAGFGTDGSFAQYGARFRAFGSSSGLGQQIFLGVGDLGVGGNRVESGFAWQTFNSVSFNYDRDADELTVVVANEDDEETLTFADLSTKILAGTLEQTNVLEINVAARDPETEVSFTTVTLNGVLLGDFSAPVGGQAFFTVSDFDFSEDFTVAGNIELNGVFPSGRGQENSRVGLTFGFSEAEPPNVEVGFVGCPYDAATLAALCNAIPASGGGEEGPGKVLLYTFNATDPVGAFIDLEAGVAGPSQCACGKEPTPCEPTGVDDAISDGGEGSEVSEVEEEDGVVQCVSEANPILALPVRIEYLFNGDPCVTIGGRRVCNTF